MDMRDRVVPSGGFVNTIPIAQGQPQGVFCTDAVYWKAYLIIPENQNRTIWFRNTLPREYRLGKIRLFVKDFHIKTLWIAHLKTYVGRYYYFIDSPILDVTLTPGQFGEGDDRNRYGGPLAYQSEAYIDKMVIDLSDELLQGQLTVYYDLWEKQFIWY